MPMKNQTDLETKSTVSQSLIIFLKGLFMGAADIIPGVSGGTIALITGIYERLINAISRINLKFILFFLRGDFERSKKNFKEIDFPLFIPLLLGIVVAIFTLSKVILFFLTAYTPFMYAFFFGLILASAIFIYKHTGELSLKNILFIIIGFLFAFLFLGLNVIQINHSLPVVFISGAIAICAMILPGISGAFYCSSWASIPTCLGY